MLSTLDTSHFEMSRLNDVAQRNIPVMIAVAARTPWSPQTRLRPKRQSDRHVQCGGNTWLLPWGGRDWPPALAWRCREGRKGSNTEQLRYRVMQMCLSKFLKGWGDWDRALGTNQVDSLHINVTRGQVEVSSTRTWYVRSCSMACGVDRRVDGWGDESVKGCVAGSVNYGHLPFTY